MSKKAAKMLEQVTPTALKKRRISEETCRKFGYGVAMFGDRDDPSAGVKVQVATYRDENGKRVGQKVRFADKKFTILGDARKLGLFGRHLWSPGKSLVITEGEIDCLSFSQIQSNKYPVVSVPNGAEGAARAIRTNLDWIEQFEKVVFMFDMDEPGQKAAKECAELLTPGKASIAKLPLKDPNEMLQAGKVKETLDAFWSAMRNPYRPDGIISGDAVWEAITNVESSHEVPYPWTFMHEAGHFGIGLRAGQIVTYCAGTGLGKSTACRELAYHLRMQGEMVGYVALEENVRRSALGFLSCHLNKPLHLTPDCVTEEELRAAYDELGMGTGGVCLYDHFGTIETKRLLAHLRYMVKGLGCTFIVLDHISIMVSGNDTDDERKSLDVAMTGLRSFVEETGVGLILVSHLKRPSKQGHEEGAVTSLSQLRGTAGIGQLSDTVIGLERDQQAAGADADRTEVRILKDRMTGHTGLVGALRYQKETGRLLEDSANAHGFKDETDTPPQSPTNTDF